MSGDQQNGIKYSDGTVIRGKGKGRAIDLEPQIRSAEVRPSRGEFPKISGVCDDSDGIGLI